MVVSLYFSYCKKIVVVGVVIGVICPVGYVAIWRTTTRGHKTYEGYAAPYATSCDVLCILTPFCQNQLQ